MRVTSRPRKPAAPLAAPCFCAAQCATLLAPACRPAALPERALAPQEPPQEWELFEGGPPAAWQLTPAFRLSCLPEDAKEDEARPESTSCFMLLIPALTLRDPPR